MSGKEHVVAQLERCNPSTNSVCTESVTDPCMCLNVNTGKESASNHQALISKLGAHPLLGSKLVLPFADGAGLAVPELTLPSLGSNSLTIADYLLQSNQMARDDFNSACTPDASLHTWNVILDAGPDLEECAAAGPSACDNQLEPDGRSFLSVHRRSEAQEIRGIDVSCGSAMEEQIHREMVEYCPEIDAPLVLSYWTRRTQKVAAARAQKAAASVGRDISRKVWEGDLQIDLEVVESFDSIAQMNQEQSELTNKPKTSIRRGCRRTSIPSEQLIAECARAVALNPKAVGNITNSDVSSSASVTHVNEESLKRPQYVVQETESPKIVRRLECCTCRWVESEHVNKPPLLENCRFCNEAIGGYRAFEILGDISLAC